MKTARRQPIEPPAKFANALRKAKGSGKKLVADEITIIPPLKDGDYWRLRASYNGIPKERKSKDDLGSVNAAYLSLSAELQSLRLGSAGLPEQSLSSLAETIESYIFQGGPKNEWRGKTAKNRKEDFVHLIALAKKENLKCANLNASVVRRFLSQATASRNRAKGIISVVQTFVKWGIGAGYFTSKQLEEISHVTWTPPQGSGYKVAPTRREQSKLHFGTEESQGGEVPTHEQVNLLANELKKHYKHGEALIHVSANLGTRTNETFIFTADRNVHEKGLGNFVDLEQRLVRVHWQYDDRPAGEGKRVTKNGKFRSVMIPPIERIQCGFDVLTWFTERSKNALIEQSKGENPLALIFPNSAGNVIKSNSFSSEQMARALKALGWKMPPYEDARGVKRSMNRFTLHSMRDRFGTTAADEWGYTERQLLEQGSWADIQTVRKFYLGTSDETFESVRALHYKSNKK